MADVFFAMAFSSFFFLLASEGLMLDLDTAPVNIPEITEECSSEDGCPSDSCGAEPSVYGVPGVPGIPGIPGSCGRPGAKGATGSQGPIGVRGPGGGAGPVGPVGAKGEQGEMGSGYKGDSGLAGPVGRKGNVGRPGVVGKTGKIGLPGVVGPKGDTGPEGPIGIKGDIGRPGLVGPKGAVGPTGPLGLKGEPGDTVDDFIDLAEHSNWKQCAWNRGDDKDSGLIESCIFIKKYEYTSLRVFFGGTLSLYNCNGCCKRWYFTFDGAECDRPMSIDAILYMKQGAGQQLQNIQRHRHIEGYCNEIPKGQVRIGFWVADCPGDYKDADAFSGWISGSRIVVEEVPPSQD